MIDPNANVERDNRGLLVPGIKVQWYQWGSGDHKTGIIVQGYHGLYGPTYLCRARGWNIKFTTKVVEPDLTLAEEPA